MLTTMVTMKMLILREKKRGGVLIAAGRANIYLWFTHHVFDNDDVLLKIMRLPIMKPLRPPSIRSSQT